MIRVALDAMGGDHAPQAEVEGALAALALLPNVMVQLVGQVEVIEAELAKHAGADRSRIVAGEGAPWTDVGWGIVLIDGFTSARWKLEKDGVLRVEAFRDLTRDERSASRSEAERLAAFLAPMGFRTAVELSIR